MKAKLLANNQNFKKNFNYRLIFKQFSKLSYHNYFLTNS